MKKLHENQFQYISGAYIDGVSKEQCRNLEMQEMEEAIRRELSKTCGENVVMREETKSNDIQITLTKEEAKRLQKKYGGWFIGA